MQELFFSQNAGCLTENTLTYDPKIQMHTFDFFMPFSAVFSIHIFVLFFLKYVLKMQEIFNAFFCRMLTFYDARFLIETMLIFRRFFRANFLPDFLMILPKILNARFWYPPYIRKNIQKIEKIFWPRFIPVNHPVFTICS